MMKYIPVLSVAGSDSSGGAGIQADLKTFSALGCYGMTVITAVTVQNTCGVSQSYPVPPSIVEAQMKAVLEDIRPRCIKIGMISDGDTLEAVCRVLRQYPDLPVVYDCVMVSSSGHPLMTKETIATLPHSLLPLCTLITPNIPEAEILAGFPVCDEASRQQAAAHILRYGCKAVLIKGGHDNQSTESCDRLYTSDECFTPHLFSSPRLSSPNTHGTGCTLSSAIAAYIARGITLPEAVALGKTYLTQALEHGMNVKTGKGTGPLNHFFAPDRLILEP